MTEVNVMHLSNEQGAANTGRYTFWEDALLNKPAYVRNRAWISDANADDVFSELPEGREFVTESRRSRLITHGGLEIYASFGAENEWNLWVSGDSETAVNGYIDAFLVRVPIAKFDDEDYIPIAFWSLNAHGDPTSTQRKVASHKWPEIRDNYPMDVRTRLDELMVLSPPEGSGKLVLWHGPPGTGKTNCIRALAHAWREWCDVDYIVDPEALFGQAHYMMSALVSVRHGADADRWRLIVIEDSGEFLRKDARAQQGQGFGRLLNLTDGLVGQGLKLIILVTTNEPFGDLHPAIARPGRCLAHLEFGPFPADEAGKWLKRKTTESMSLADLYEAKAEVQTQITKERNEFRPGVYV